MKTDLEIISSFITREYDELFGTIDSESVTLIKNKISEIPISFYEPRIAIDETSENKISLLEFSLKTAKMSNSSRKGLMEKYNIDPYDMEKLQCIIDSIKITREYASVKEVVIDKKENENISYGIALSNQKQLDKAYPLWIAYLYTDSVKPYDDIKRRLRQDGTDGKYTPEYIVGLIEHTNSLLCGHSTSEKKKFFIDSISDILNEDVEINKRMKDEVEI